MTWAHKARGSEGGEGEGGGCGEATSVFLVAHGCPGGSAVRRRGRVVAVECRRPAGGQRGEGARRGAAAGPADERCMRLHRLRPGCHQLQSRRPLRLQGRVLLRGGQIHRPQLHPEHRLRRALYAREPAHGPRCPRCLRGVRGADYAFEMWVTLPRHEGHVSARCPVPS